MEPAVEKNADYFAAIGLVTFCDIVWGLSLWVCMESSQTYCSLKFAPRLYGVFIIFTCFFFFSNFNYMCKFTGQEFSCLLKQTVINFFAATEKHVGTEAGPVQNTAGFHNENITNFKRPNFDSGRQENCLKALRIFKKKCGYIFKRSLVNQFRTQGNVFWYKIGSVLKVKRSTTAYRLFERVRTMYYDYKLMSGTKMERAVSPESNANVSSKRNLKNDCKKLERQPLKRLQLCRRRLVKVEIIFLRCIW